MVAIFFFSVKFFSQFQSFTFFRLNLIGDATNVWMPENLDGITTVVIEGNAVKARLCVEWISAKKPVTQLK